MEQYMDEYSEGRSNVEVILANILKTPGIKVDRRQFLSTTFKSKNQEQFDALIKKGPIEAQISQHELSKIAKNLINKRTAQSTSASFLAGLPGGIVMAATIPADVAQFFAITLRLAQELAYLYGYEEIWIEDNIVDEKVMNEMILFLGVMFGVSGSTTILKLVSSGLSKQIMKTF